MKAMTVLSRSAGLACLLLVLALGRSAGAGSLTHPWTEYFGAQDALPTWGKTVRGLGRGVTGVLPPAGGTASQDSPEFKALEQQLRDVLARYDVVIPVGGLGSGRQQDTLNRFMQTMEKDGGRSWKEIVGNQAKRLAALPNGNRIYWQVGNEINSRHFSQTMRGWQGSIPLVRPDDAFIIPYYAEYFLAPTVEALRSLAPPPAQPIKIVLGSIAGARRDSSRAWLNSLLHYRVQGQFAASLKGKAVNELVDVVGIHYLVTASDPDNWQERLRKYTKELIGQGRIQAVWATEELGGQAVRAGLGAAATLKVAGRYLHWWSAEATAPGQGRCIYWGWQQGEQGKRGKDAMEALYDFIGDTPLTEVPGAVTLPRQADMEELYTFQSTKQPGKRIVIASATGRGGLDGLTVSWGGSGSIKATLKLFAPSGMSSYPLTSRGQEGRYELQLPAAISFAEDSALLVTMEKQ